MAKTASASRKRRSATKSNTNLSITVKEKKSKPKKRVSKGKSLKLDALKPKKPPTAFFYFLEDFRKDFQEQNPNVKSMREIGKACGDKWKTMTYECFKTLIDCVESESALVIAKVENPMPALVMERYRNKNDEALQNLLPLEDTSLEKVKYYDIATEKRAEFDKAMAEFIKKKESGEFEEIEDDSEFDE